MEGEAGPPQPILKTVTANISRFSQTAGHMPLLLNFLRSKYNGTARKGSKINPEDVLSTVSAKTTVTWYVPAGVVEAVEIVNNPVEKV